MSVRTNELDNPERGQAGALTDRGPAAPPAQPPPPPPPPRGAEQVARDIANAKAGAPPAPTVEKFAERLEAAKALMMPSPHCSHCAQAWTDGRDAGLRALAGG